MKNILSILSLFCMVFCIKAQSDTIVLSDERDQQDFDQFQKLEMVRLVDSLNALELYNEEFYSLDEDGRILMDEVASLPMPKFNTQLEKKYYYWLKKKLYNAYPYYLMAVKNYENLNDSLVRFEKNRKVKKYIKKRQKQLANEYEDKLRGLTRTEGQILSKLMFRRTEKTTYEIIKELRGSINAYVWEAKAGFFDISLKTEFNPEKVREDMFLDHIIRKGIITGELEDVDDVLIAAQSE